LGGWITEAEGDGGGGYWIFQFVPGDKGGDRAFLQGVQKQVGLGMRGILFFDWCWRILRVLCRHFCDASMYPTALPERGGGFIFGTCLAISPFLGCLVYAGRSILVVAGFFKPERLNATKRL